ncbi:hypothetical protein FQZ97_852770 [compost metagenome]
MGSPRPDPRVRPRSPGRRPGLAAGGERARAHQPAPAAADRKQPAGKTVLDLPHDRRLSRLWPAGVLPGLGARAALRRPRVHCLLLLRGLHARFPGRVHGHRWPVFLAPLGLVERRGAGRVHALADGLGHLVRARGLRGVALPPRGGPLRAGLVGVWPAVRGGLRGVDEPHGLPGAQPLRPAVGAAELYLVYLDLAPGRDLRRLDGAGLPAGAPGLPLSRAAQRGRAARQLGHAVRGADRLGHRDSAAAVHPAPPGQGLQREPGPPARHRQHRPPDRPDHRARAPPAPARRPAPCPALWPPVWPGAGGAVQPRRDRRPRGPRGRRPRAGGGRFAPVGRGARGGHRVPHR